LHLFAKEKNLVVIPHFAVVFIFQGDVEKAWRHTKKLVHAFYVD